MKSIRAISIAAALSLFVLAPGIAFAHSHRPADDQGHAQQEIHGTLSGGLAALMMGTSSITVTTDSGQTVTITLTPNTQIDFEAQGSEAEVMGGSAKVVISAEVRNHNGTLTATAIDAHLRVADRPHQDHTKHHHDH